jgi:hypothetical protein
MSCYRKLASFATRLLLGSAILGAGIGGADAACKLNSPGGAIKHVVYIVFDNVHLRRDKPNVPSDLEQMPTLLNFLTNNGFISGNHWTPLISHTADDIVTGLTGVYGDRHGIPVANSYGYFKPDGTVGFSSSFLYWTALAGDGQPEMINENGVTAPAPWVPYTRAGCDVGAFSVANIELENLPADIRTFFGVGSPEDQAATAAFALPATPANAPARQAPNTDYLGIAVHCAQNSPLCNNSHARNDVLPSEPGGYTGFSALFGNVNVAPVICAAAPAGCNAGNVMATDGTVIADAYGRPGFPNVFSPTAAQSLGYAATMLEAGLPVVYFYIADLHDRNPLPLDPTSNLPTAAHAFGPGEAEYVNQAKNYDTAFATFFSRLSGDGINASNTLFVVVPDENDHFVGSQPSPASCDGVNVPCTYTAVSEISASLNRLLVTQKNNSTPFSVHSDDAPTVYITGNPGPANATTRQLEKDMSGLTAVNPITSNTDNLSVFMADQAAMKMLHMVTKSPARTPSFTMFGNPDYFFSTSANNTNCSQSPACVSLSQAPFSTFAWNHGDVQTEITRTWVGMAGPGVQHLGIDSSTFSDHTDVRPTMMALLGLADDYVHDGRVLAEKMNPISVPLGIQNSPAFVSLAQVYKQLNAPLGALSLATLAFSNASVLSNDTTYGTYLSTMAQITSDRDALAGQMKPLLANAAFSNQAIDSGLAQSLGQSAQALIAQVQSLSAGATPLFTAVLPNARTTTVGNPDTAFAAIINGGSVNATSCAISLPANVPAILNYQTTTPANALSGTPNTPANIAAGATQNFVFAVTPTTTFSQDIPLVFQCANTSAAGVVEGLNTLLVTSSATAVPDMLSIAQTVTADGNLVITGANGSGAVAVATIDIGAAGTVTVTPSDTPPGQPARNLPVSLSICQTNPTTGACINPTTPGPSVTLSVAANQMTFFTIFVNGQGTLVPYDPANNRIFVISKSGSGTSQVTVGEASTALKMQ